MNDKRFISDDPFSTNLDENAFHKIMSKQFYHFNENGIVPACPRCHHCNDAFLKLDIPDQKEDSGLKEIKKSKLRMKSYFEIHIEKLIEDEIKVIRPEIEKRIRQKFITLDSSAASSASLG